MQNILKLKKQQQQNAQKVRYQNLVQFIIQNSLGNGTQVPQQLAQAIARECKTIEGYKRWIAAQKY